MRLNSFKISQRFHVTDVISNLEKTIFRYGQLVFYFFGIGIISLVYIISQKLMVNYIDALALGQLPIITN